MISPKLKRHSLMVGVFVLSLIFSNQALFAQNTLEKFGKNRIQYKRFNWRNLSTLNFDIYYYDNGSRLANFATRFLESEFDEITDILGYTPYSKTKIFIYNSITDLQQSNIGIDDDNVITGGQTDFFKSQVEIPYTGSEVEFKNELRQGIALMLVREMMFGGSLKDMLQSSYLGKFSEWFLLGASAYVARGWNEEMDDHLRDLFQRRKIKKPNLLSGKDAILVGQSIWNFIAEEYGSANISNILNLARIIRNERNSIGSSLGIRYKDFLKKWETYYSAMSKEVIARADSPEFDFKLRKRNRKGFVFNEFKISPDGTRIAYSENYNGKYKVVIQDLRNKRRKVLLRKGYRAINQRYDDNIPLISWRDNNNLGVMYVKKGETRLRVYNKKKKVNYERIWFFFNHVSGFDFSDDGNNLVMSADRKGQPNFKTGQNDIFIFNLENTTLKQVTDDWYDDLTPEFLPNSNLGFTFSSNRTDDTLRTTLLTDRGNINQSLSNFDVFIYNPLQTSTRVIRLTDSPGKDLYPSFLDKDHIAYINDQNGVYQLNRVNIKTGQTQILTNYGQSIRRFDVHPTENGLAYLMIKKGRLYPYYKKEFNFDQNLNANFSTERIKVLAGRLAGTRVVRPKKTLENFEPVQEVDVNPDESYGPDEVNTDDYRFDPDVLEQYRSGLDRAQDSVKEIIEKANEQNEKPKGPYDYEPRFRTENVVTSVQIDPLRGWGILLNLSTSDLLENHKIRGGFLMITDLRSSDFYGEYQYYARRLDYKLRYDRKTIFFNNDVLTQRYTLNKAAATISFPIRNTSRVSLTPFYASTFWTSLDIGFIPLDNHRIHYAGARIEYVYDNTVLNGQNMISGTRIKFAYENYQSVDFNDGYRRQFADFNGIDSPRDLSFDKLSLDVRNYTKIHKDIILATRIAYGRFGGRRPKSFLLGGMDNWLFNQTDDGGGDTNPLAINPGDLETFDNSDILFHEFVTNLRGFNYNKISGENFFLVNLEIRFPIIKYLFGKRVNSNFLKNLQLVGFYDIGSAWTGISPFNRENSLNTRNVGNSNTPFTATVNDFKNPWLAGYGAGLRTVLLGYYLKLDMAWGVEDFVTTDKPKFYLTFGYDF